MKRNGATYYYITNLQGDVMKMVDAEGNVVASYEYDPYGKVLSATGTMATANPLRYRGYYYDSELEMYYLQSRYYDPNTGRFLNADDVSMLGASGTVLGYNLFAYCENNPANMADPTGHVGADVIGAAIGLVIGIVGGAFLGNWLANLIGIKNKWVRRIFVGAVSVLAGATAAYIGSVVGPYLAKSGKAILDGLKSLAKKNTFRSLGSTGRTTAKNLIEKLAMEQVKSDPLKWGKQLTKVVMSDKRWPAAQGWVKMQAVIETSKGNVVIHFVYNTILGYVDDFKFK